MIDDPKVQKVVRDGYLRNQTRFDMRSKCKCGSTATREHKGNPVCIFCSYKLKGVTA